MSIEPISLGLESSPARFKQGGSATIINGYIERAGDEAKSPWHIYPTDGLQGYAVLTDADGGVRAGIEVGGALYVVAGTRAYKIATNQTVTLLGSMNISETAHVKMSRNRRSSPDVMISCDGLAYNIRADVLSQISDGDLLAPLDHDFMDGYFGIVTAQGKWQIGALDDATAWDALDYARADGDPDAAVAMSAMQGQFLVMGEKTIEPWQNTGAADFPFERVTVIDKGCLAAGSVQRLEQSVAWVADDRSVRMMGAGYAAKKVSTTEVERAIENLTDRSIIKSATWTRDGHIFYSLTAPGYWTWCYDVSTDRWHKRQSYGRPDWRVSTVTAFDGKLIAGDAETGTLYEMSPAFYDEAGEPHVLEVITPPIHAFPYRLRHNRLFIDLERGVGTGQGDDQDITPELMVDWSDDGGNTFGNERTVAIGEQGQRMVRVGLLRLGLPRGDNGRVYRFRISAKVRRGFYAASLDVDKLAA